MMFAVLLPVSVIAVLGVLVAAGVFVLQRVRSGQPVGLSFRTIATSYFHFMSIAAFIVLTVGLATGFKAGLSDAFGRSFSYNQPPFPKAAPPGAQPVQAPESAIEQSRQQSEAQYRNDLIQGGTLAVVGAFVWALHEFGRRRMSVEADDSRLFFARARTTLLLGIYGVAGLIAFATAVYELLRFFLLSNDPMMGNQPPGASVATAIVFVPVWMYYLAALLKRTKEEPSLPAGVSGGSPGIQPPGGGVDVN